MAFRLLDISDGGTPFEDGLSALLFPTGEAPNTVLESITTSWVFPSIPAPLVNTAEGGTDTVDATSANTGGVSGDAFVVAGTGPPKFSTAAAFSGALGYSAPAGASLVGYLEWTFPSPNPEASVSYWFKTSGTTTGDIRTLAFRNAAGNSLGGLLLSTTRTLRLMVNTVGYASSATESPALTADTWYLVQIAFRTNQVASGGYYNFKIFNANLTTFHSGSGILPAAVTNLGPINNIRIIRPINADYVGVAYFDSIRADSGRITTINEAVVIPVVKSLSTTWNTLATTTTPVSNTLSTSWNVNSVVSKALATSWNVRANISKALSTSWNVNAQVSKALSTTWIVRSIINKALSTTWNVNAQISKSLGTTWNTNAQVVKALSTTWHVNAQISKAFSTTWNVLVSGLTPVSNALATSWNVRAQISKSISTTWHVNAIITKALATTWNVRAYVSQTLSTLWNVRAYISQSRSTLWNVLVSVPKTFSTTWGVRSYVTKPISTSWHTRAYTTNSLSTSWNAYSIISKPISTTWNTKALVYKPISITWNTRSYVSKGIVIRWNTLGSPVTSQWALWNGTSLEPLTLEGWWDGNAIQPITPWTGEMST